MLATPMVALAAITNFKVAAPPAGCLDRPISFVVNAGGPTASTDEGDTYELTINFGDSLSGIYQNLKQAPGATILSHTYVGVGTFYWRGTAYLASGQQLESAGSIYIGNCQPTDGETVKLQVYQPQGAWSYGVYYFDAQGFSTAFYFDIDWGDGSAPARWYCATAQGSGYIDYTYANERVNYGILIYAEGYATASDTTAAPDPPTVS